jgi:predicted porin
MKKALATSALGLFALGAHAQSSVTLYGIVDTGIGYQSSSAALGSNSGGRSVVKMNNGIWAGSRFGLKGSEDLGGGTKAIFQLEQGFNSATGAQSVNGLGFSRQAWIGVTNPTYGTLTAGRQYTSYYTLLSPYSPTTWLTGAYGAHPGDLDSLDTIYRANNSLVYTSPKMYGVTVSGSYSLGGVPGSFNAGSTWSAAVQYLNGPFGIAAGFQRINNSTPGGGLWGPESTTSNNGATSGSVGHHERLPHGAGSAALRGYRRLRVQLAMGRVVLVLERAIHSGCELGFPSSGDVQHGWRSGALQADRRTRLGSRL